MSSGSRPKIEQVIPLAGGMSKFNLSCLSTGFKPMHQLPTIKSQQRGWNILTRIYLLPSRTKCNANVKSAPYMFEETFIWSKRHNYDDYTHRRNKYHILVQRRDYPFQTWNLEMNKLVLYSEKLEILVWQVAEMQNKPGKLKIITTFFVWKYCETYFRSLRPGMSYPMSLAKIESNTSHLNTLDYNFPVRVFLLNGQKANIPMIKAPKFWEVKTRKLNVGQIFVHILLDKRNTSRSITVERHRRDFIPINAKLRWHIPTGYKFIVLRPDGGYNSVICSQLQSMRQVCLAEQTCHIFYQRG